MTSSSTPPDDVVFTVSSTAEIAPARRFVRDVAGAVLEERIDDVVLTTSELVSNALEHGSGGEVTVRVRVDPSTVAVAVDSVSDGLPHPPDRSLRPAADRASDRIAIPAPPASRVPMPSKAGGRGLEIVSALADRVSVSARGRRVEISCWFSYG